jgi:hypothetical protein
MARVDVPSFAGTVAVLATMHGKERVIVPLLEGALGLTVRVPPRFDTDRFGTFSREIARSGSQLDAARAKIEAAFDADPCVRIGISSEGSFGPHPYVPFAPLARELVLMIDRETRLELTGYHAGLSTNFAHRVVTDVPGAMEFAKMVGFPAHGLIVIGCRDREPAPDLFLNKNIVTKADLRRAVEDNLARTGKAFVETDMRAHRNPTRMRAIRRATVNLIRRYRSHCPACDHRGFWIIERPLGLPCSWCGGPTHAVRADVLSCEGCGHRVERPVAATTADPGLCNDCNP